MNLQHLIDRLNELKNQCELDASQVDVRIKLTDCDIDRFDDADLEHHLKFENFWVWKDELVDLDSYQGFCSDTGKTKIFEAVVIQGGQ